MTSSKNHQCAPHLDFSQVLPRLGEKLPGSTHMNEKSSRSHAVTWTTFLLARLVWAGCVMIWQVKIQRMDQQIIAKVFGWGSVVHNFVKFPFMTGKSERSDIILGRQLIWCFECQGHGVFTHLCLRATAKKTKDDYVSKKERLEENCKKKTHDPETVVSK